MSSNKPTLVVLAAGIGSRYGGLKQIDPVGPSGEIVIDYSLFDAIRAGFGKVVFVIRRDIEAPFRAMIEPHIKGRIAFEYVFQDMTDLPTGFSVPADRKKPWGTSHAVRACRHIVKEPFAVINADDFYGRQSYRVLCDYLKNVSARSAEFSLVAFVLRNTLSEHGSVARGVCRVSPQGLLEGVVENLKIEKDGNGARSIWENRVEPMTGDEVVSMNMWGFTPALFDYLERDFPAFLKKGIENPKAEFLLPTLVDQLIREGCVRCHVLTSNDKWLGVTYPEDKPIVMAGVRERIRAGEYPEKLWG